MAILSIDKSNWELVKLGEVAHEVRESLTKSNIQVDRSVGLEHIEPGDLHIRSWDDLDESSSFTKVFRDGNVLFGRRRAYLKKAALADFNGVCSGDITVISASEDLLPSLLPFVVSSDRFFAFAVEHSAGGLSPRVKWKDLANYKFLLPPKDQQAEIAELLWAADDMYSASKELITCTGSLYDSVVLRCANSMEKEELIEFCNDDGVRIGPFGSLLHKSDYQSSGVPVVMPNDMKDGSIDADSVKFISVRKAQSLEAYSLVPGDILFPRRGDLSKRAIVSQNQLGWICGTGSIRVRLKPEISVELAYHLLASHATTVFLESNAVGTTMPNINASVIKKIPFGIKDDGTALSWLEEIQHIESGKQESESNANTVNGLFKSLVSSIFDF